MDRRMVDLTSIRKPKLADKPLEDSRLAKMHATARIACAAINPSAWHLQDTVRQCMRRHVCVFVHVCMCVSLCVTVCVTLTVSVRICLYVFVFECVSGSVCGLDCLPIAAKTGAEALVP